MEIKNFKLEFTELEEDENLYEDVNLDYEFIVDAQYYKRTGYETCPDICAIPKMPSNKEILTYGTVHLRTYNREAVTSMSKVEKLEALRELDDVMIPLGLHFDIASAINSHLIASYRGRFITVSDYANENPKAKKGYAFNVLSIRDTRAPRPTGFFIYGKTGTGKSMGLHLMSRMYPRVISHTFDGMSYCQIPIIFVTAMQNQTTSIFISMAAELDTILDTGELHQAKMRSTNLARMKTILKNWIKLYHIGLIIIDEIQFMNIGGKKTGLEDIIGIMEETGCHFGLIGNDDAMEALQKVPRLMSRLQSDYINTNLISPSSSLLFDHAMKTLWEYQWTSKITPLNKDIKDTLLYLSDMNITLLKYILMKIQTVAIRMKTEPEIDDTFISRHVSESIKTLRLLIADPKDMEKKALAEYTKQLKADMDKAIEDQRESSRASVAESLLHGESLYKQTQIKVDALNSLIQITEFSESQINRAINKAMDTNPSLADHPPKFLVKEALEVLNKAKKTAARRKKTAVQRDDDLKLAT